MTNDILETDITDLSEKFDFFLPWAGPNQSVWLTGYESNARLDRYHDLGDVAFIDHAVMGFVQCLDGKFSQTQVICFTCDDVEAIKRRTGLLQATLKSLTLKVRGWQLRPCQGPAYCVDKNFNGIRLLHRIVPQYGGDS